MTPVPMKLMVVLFISVVFSFIGFVIGGLVYLLYYMGPYIIQSIMQVPLILSIPALLGFIFGVVLAIKDWDNV